MPTNTETYLNMYTAASNQQHPFWMQRNHKSISFDNFCTATYFLTQPKGHEINSEKKALCFILKSYNPQEFKFVSHWLSELNTILPSFFLYFFLEMPSWYRHCSSYGPESMEANWHIRKLNCICRWATNLVFVQMLHVWYTLQGINIHIPPNGKFGKSSSSKCPFLGGYVIVSWRVFIFVCSLKFMVHVGKYIYLHGAFGVVS